MRELIVIFYHTQLEKLKDFLLVGKKNVLYLVHIPQLTK